MYAVISFPVCNVKNFENNLSFLIKPFSYRTKKVRTKFKYLQIEKIFLGDIKSLCYYFKKVLVTRNCLRPESEPLKGNDIVNMSV